MQLGVIADDFTGATDIASFLVNNGMTTIQVNGVPDHDFTLDNNIDAVVVSLKSRSCPVNEALLQSLAALRWLKSIGCKQFYFKYCSTFDSTDTGNIGPVTDALLDALNETQTIISPALPVNGRTVYQGYLFVMDKLLSDSGMRNHPINPMKDSNLIRLMEQQASGKCGLIPFEIVEQGSLAVSQHLNLLKNQGVNYVIVDTLTQQNLITQGEAVRNMKLVTGGSGLAIGLAKQWAKPGIDITQAQQAGKPEGKKCVVLSGSCSIMTNTQVAVYQQKAPAKAIDIEQCLGDEKQQDDYAEKLCQWVEKHTDSPLAPLIYATTDTQQLQKIQTKWGTEKASKAIESLFAKLTQRLFNAGFTRFIVAGGETSGIVVQSLDVVAFYIGPTISPGVPWIKSINQSISLALKSGNFGDKDFFARAQQEFNV